MLNGNQAQIVSRLDNNNKTEKQKVTAQEVYTGIVEPSPFSIVEHARKANRSVSPMHGVQRKTLGGRRRRAARRKTRKSPRRK